MPPLRPFSPPFEVRIFLAAEAAHEDAATWLDTRDRSYELIKSVALAELSEARQIRAVDAKAASAAKAFRGQTGGEVHSGTPFAGVGGFEGSTS